MKKTTKNKKAIKKSVEASNELHANDTPLSVILTNLVGRKEEWRACQDCGLVYVYKEPAWKRERTHLCRVCREEILDNYHE